MKVFVAGYPGNMGGANTEAYHTAKMWAQCGLCVEWIPTWGEDPEQEEKLAAIGNKTHHVKRDDLKSVPGLKGAIVVGFCNSRFCEAMGDFRRLGCRLAFVNCMTFCFDHERIACDEHGAFDAYVFQSEFQRATLLPRLARWGVKPGDPRLHLIRGAFAVDEWPFRPRPHAIDEEFIVGRLARPDKDKWSANIWKIYGAIPYDRLRARMMGWTIGLAQKCGPPPKWAECLPPQAEPAQDFFARLHCCLPVNGGAEENWPRVGLEAMAAGVPLVTQRQWGWCEMIESGVSGYLCSTDKELAFAAAQLAHDEPRRMAMAHAARARVEKLSDPQELWPRWKRLFNSLGADF